jgi:hypothetical protein
VGPVDFRYTQVTSNLDASGAQFQFADQKTGADFSGMRVGRIVFLTASAFTGPLLPPLLLKDAEVGELRISGGGAMPLAVGVLDLSQTAVRGELRIENGSIGLLRAPFLRVLGPATLSRLSIQGTADLQHAHFQSLSWIGVNWPPAQDRTKIKGMTYDHITAEGTDGSSARVLDWVKGSKYSSQAFAQLESYLKLQGDSAEADDAFVSGKSQERRRTIAFWSGDWWQNAALAVLVGYGRHPVFAFGWSFLVVLLGWWVFRKHEYVEPRKEDDWSKPFSPFWYSVNLFLPVIHLESEEVWTPNHEHWWRCQYARVHVLLGWILIPIGAAAITGLIK